MLSPDELPVEIDALPELFDTIHDARRRWRALPVTGEMVRNGTACALVARTIDHDMTHCYERAK